MHTRDRILLAAHEILIERGPRAITIAAVAARVGISGPAIYKHFSGRDELVQRLRTDAWAALNTALASTQTGELERLLEVGERYVDFGLDHPHIYRLLFMSAGLVSPSAEEIDAPDDAGLGVLIAHIIACQQTGALDPSANPFELAVACWATCHGFVSLYLESGAAARFPLATYRALSRRALQQLFRARP